ncbi:MAG: 3-hydroxyacyl-CoA dehydrogenase [Gammaproteobacteria bacterium]|nr:3-hydroxyacyl-CoA dehydrogenase [Gammaproteobacteria bacterium]
MNRIGVIGAGIMGRGIVQLFAQAGFEVRFFDVDAEAVSAAHTFVEKMIDRQAEKGKIEPGEARAIKSRLLPADAMEALADCGVIIEAVLERLDLKQQIFGDLERIAGPDALLCSNTSSLMVAEIARGCEQPERVAGLHFFNPVPLMRVVEVVAAVRTSAATVTTLREVIARTGHRAVVALDQPGFLVNHAGRGLLTEGLRVLEEGVAPIETIDTLIREAGGFRMGPFELMDLTGLDISGKVMASIYEQFNQEPRFRPSALVPPRLAAGLFGRKTGEGWYRYEDGGKVGADAATPAPDVPVAGTEVWIAPDADQADELAALVERAGARQVDVPSGDALLVVQPWGYDATTIAVAGSLDARRTVAVDPLPGLDKHRTLMLTAATEASFRDRALTMLGSDGVPVTCVNDSPGFVVQRILAMIVNIATEIAQRRIAEVDDIEAAVKLGLGYPDGPLALGDAVGAERILLILEHMQTLTGDPRYRPSAWLRRRARLGLSLKTPEAGR